MNIIIANNVIMNNFGQTALPHLPKSWNTGSKDLNLFVS